MQTLRRSVSLLLLAYALSACSNDDAKPAKDAGSEDEQPDADVEEEPDAGDEPESDAGSAPTTEPVPLTVWVDDLVDNHTTGEAEPDTVDDKVITDDTDESSFDKYLQRPQRGANRVLARATRAARHYWLQG